MHRVTACNTEGSVKSLAPSVRDTIAAKGNRVGISTSNFDYVANTFNQGWYIHWPNVLCANTELAICVGSHGIHVAPFVRARNKHGVVLTATDTRDLDIEAANFWNLVASALHANS